MCLKLYIQYEYDLYNPNVKTPNQLNLSLSELGGLDTKLTWTHRPPHPTPPTASHPPHPIESKVNSISKQRMWNSNLDITHFTVQLWGYWPWPSNKIGEYFMFIVYSSFLMTKYHVRDNGICLRGCQKDDPCILNIQPVILIFMKQVRRYLKFSKLSDIKILFSL